MHKMRACNFCLCTYIGVRGLRAGRVRAREKNFGGPRCDGSAAATTDRTLTSFASGILPLPPPLFPLPSSPPPGAAFSRSIAKLSKLSNRGQRAYNAKVRNRGAARMRGRTCIARAIRYKRKFFDRIIFHVRVVTSRPHFSD